MRFMMIVKASTDSEAGVMPANDLITAMGRYNEQLVAAGVLRDAAGLQPSSKGARVQFSKGGTVVIDGPFAETKELIAGYWIIEVASTQDAVEWARRCPSPMTDDTGTIEIRPLFEPADFADMTPEMRAHDETLRAQIAAAKR